MLLVASLRRNQEIVSVTDFKSDRVNEVIFTLKLRPSNYSTHLYLNKGKFTAGFLKDVINITGLTWKIMKNTFNTQTNYFCTHENKIQQSAF